MTTSHAPQGGVAPLLPRNFVHSALLQLIGQGPAYGYTLRDQLAAIGVCHTDFGQLYRTLRSMEKDGLVLSCWGNSETGPSRRTYHVTDKGRSQLADWAEALIVGQLIVQRFLGRAVRPRVHPASNL
jgi:poly-beta-hydroxybutyrate-responsive repressor